MHHLTDCTDAFEGEGEQINIYIYDEGGGNIAEILTSGLQGPV